jgi:phosphoglycerate dehydrogenase-like enzyme
MADWSTIADAVDVTVFGAPLAGEDALVEAILRTLPNVLATPQLGYVTRRNYHTFYREAVEDIAAFLAGAPVRQIS